MEEGKIICMTSKEIDKYYPLNKEVVARTKAMQDADIEPFFDDEHPDIDVYHPEKPYKESVLSKLLNHLFGIFAPRSSAT